MFQLIKNMFQRNIFASQRNIFTISTLTLTLTLTFSCGNAVEIFSLTDLTDLKDYIFDIDFDFDIDLLRAGGGVSHRSHRFKGLYFRR